MDLADTRGEKKKFKDNSKRINAKENKERQYRKDQRAIQSQVADEDNFGTDDSDKFLKKLREKEEKALKGSQKALIYEQEMEKCMPKPKGKMG